MNRLKVILFSVMLVIVLSSCNKLAKTKIMVKVKNITGNVYVMLFGETQYKLIDKETILSEYDSIKTDDNSACDIEFPDGSLVKLDYKTEINIAKLNTGFKKKSFDVLLSVIKGTIIAKVEKRDSKFEVETTNAIAGVRGTKFLFNKESDKKIRVMVMEGIVYGFKLDKEFKKYKKMNKFEIDTNLAKRGQEIIIDIDKPILIQKAQVMKYTFRGERFLNIDGKTVKFDYGIRKINTKSKK